MKSIEQVLETEKRLGPLSAHRGKNNNPRSQSQDLDNGVDRSVNFVALMVHEAREANKGLSPENTILVRIGTHMPHPEPYSGEPDLERFQVFIAGLLRWLSMNQLLGSDPENDLNTIKVPWHLPNRQCAGVVRP